MTLDLAFGDGPAVAVLQLRLEVVRAAAGLPEYSNQAMAANSVEREIERKGGEEDADQADAQVSSPIHAPAHVGALKARPSKSGALWPPGSDCRDTPRWRQCSFLHSPQPELLPGRTALQVLDLIEVPEGLYWWRRWESNPRPEILGSRHLHQ